MLALDAAQYQLDANRMAESDGEDVYAGMNILLRRKPKENNFKAILECIRDLTNADVVVPEWLHDIFLGYGDPAAAQPANMPNQLRTVDFKDTFLDAQHLRESFPGREVVFSSTTGARRRIRRFESPSPNRLRTATRRPGRSSWNRTCRRTPARTPRTSPI